MNKFKELLEKSKSEQEVIAKFLENEGFHFIHEHPFLIVEDDGKVRIWYPDFYLPYLNIVIEYFGMPEDVYYRIGMDKKRETYNKLKINLVEITPKTFIGNWKRYLIMEMMSVLEKRKDKINKRYNKLNKLSEKHRNKSFDISSELIGEK